MRLAQLLVAIIALLTVACGGGDTKLKCTSNDDCHTDTGGVIYACDSVTQVCLRACTASTMCLDSSHCDTAAGVCRDGTASGGDPGSGDPAGDSAGDSAGDPAGD